MRLGGVQVKHAMVVALIPIVKIVRWSAAETGATARREPPRRSEAARGTAIGRQREHLVEPRRGPGRKARAASSRRGMRGQVVVVMVVVMVLEQGQIEKLRPAR